MTIKSAIIELGIDSSRLGYFDDKKEVLELSDIYKFPARHKMTDDEYTEYMFTLNDLILHYDYVLVCTDRSIMKFEGDITSPRLVSNRAILGDVRFGIKDTVIINNPYYERYVAQANGENGLTVISENGQVEIIYPNLS